METETKQPHERESRKWWAVVDGRVEEVTGYSCAPNNASDGPWWCPEVGYTLTEGHHLFTLERSALAKAIDEHENEVVCHNLAIAKLKNRLNGLPK